MEIVEEGTENIIKELQEKNIPLMGLTTQGLGLSTRTVLQLDTLGIDLSKTAPCKEDCYFVNQRGVLFRNGLLFTEATPKGSALLQFLQLCAHYPKRVVFINDKHTHLADVEQALEQQGIDFIGLRYSYTDARVARFSRAIADIQWTHSTLDHLLSDEEAAGILDRIETCRR